MPRKDKVYASTPLALLYNGMQRKACNIKDPTQNIIWVAPESGDGPNYSGQ